MSFSQLNFLASAIKDGSIIPPRRRRTKCSVDSATNTVFWLTKYHNHMFVLIECLRHSACTRSTIPGAARADIHTLKEVTLQDHLNQSKATSRADITGVLI